MNVLAENSRYERILVKEERWKRCLRRWLPGYQFSNEYYEYAIHQLLRPGIKWVDLGCARNDFILEMDHMGSSSYGLDLEIHPKLNTDSHNRFMIANLNSLPFPQNSLDMLTANDVIEHLSDPSICLQQVYNALNPNGSLVLRTPNKIHPIFILSRIIPHSIKKVIIKALFGVSNEDVFPTLYRANTEKKMRKILTAAGFEKIDIRLIEDIHTAYTIGFGISLVSYFLGLLPILKSFRTYLVVVAIK